MACAVIGGAVAVQASSPELPTEVREGKTYYRYVPVKGESVFGILSRFGWDEDLFRAVNPGVTELTKDVVLYYPAEPLNVASEAKAEAPDTVTAAVSVKTETEKQTEEQPIRTEIAASTEKTDAGVSPAGMPAGASGSELILPVPTDSIQEYEEPIVYISRQGDTPLSLAREYHTTLADIFALNPRLSPDGMVVGSLIKLLPGSETNHIQARMVTERRPMKPVRYKVRKGDTWESIAAEKGVSAEELKAVNPKTDELKNGKNIDIPQYENISASKQVLVLDGRELTEEGREQIYREVNGLLRQAPSDVHATLLVNTNANERKRCVEFMRGFMLGLETLRKTPYKVHLKVAEINSETAPLEDVLSDEEIIKSDIIFATDDKAFPEELIAFGQNNNITVVNVFDSKIKAYTDNDRYIQLLAPTDFFFGRTADHIAGLMGGRTFIFIGSPNADEESFSVCLKDALGGNASIEYIEDISALESYQFDPAKQYAVVSELSGRTDVMPMIDAVIDIKEAHPGLTLSVIGRPTWLVFSDANAEKLSKADTYFPSRFYLDADDPAVKAFEKRYGGYYKAHTVKSLPAYAAMGYDAARYFIDSYANTAGDWNKVIPARDLLQLDFKPGSVNSWGGLLNKGVYLLNYSPDGAVKKIMP